MDDENQPLLSGRTETADGSIQNADQRNATTLSSHRWYMLLVMSLFNFSTGMIWITFGPIADITAEYYEVGDAQVNWLAIVFMICCIPVGVFAIWTLDACGLKLTMHIGAWLNFIGAAVRLVSIFEEIPIHKRYAVLLTGQMIAAVAQPFALFAPTKLAATWFPPSQRAKANMICSMANPIGIMLASILSPVIVHNKDHLFWMLELTCVPAAVTLCLTLFGVKSSRPPHPPSPCAVEPIHTSWRGLKQVAFWVLAVCFGTGVALFTSLTTLIQQILCPFGYTDEFAGLCGALLFAAGLVGAGIASAFVDRTKKFEETAKVCMCIATLFTIVFAVVSVRKDCQVLIALTICGLGCFGFAAYPVSLELSVESTYPVTEATSSGILMISGQVQSMIAVLIMQSAARPFASEYSTCHGSSADVSQDYTVSNLLFAGMGCVSAVLLTFCYKCEYRRLHSERLLIAEYLPSMTYDVI